MKNFILIFILICTSTLYAQNIFINEINYAHPDSKERGVELAGPANSSFTNYEIKLIDKKGQVYHTEKVSGTFPPSGVKGIIWFPVAELQTQHNGRIHLNDTGGSLIQEVEYGTQASGFKPKSLTGIIQTDSTQSLQLIGTGLLFTDFIWVNTQLSSPGFINLNQIFQLILKVSPPTPLVSYQQNIFTWNTIQSPANTTLYIERSVDGLNYEVIGTITNWAANEEKKEYQYTDTDESDRVWIYRIRAVDDQGNEEISASLKFEAKAEVKVGPNPLQPTQALQIRTNLIGEYKVVITDGLGRPVYVESVSQTNIDINIPNLRIGLYNYHIQQKGKIVKSGKLIIQ